jgi:hypothetical protein
MAVLVDTPTLPAASWPTSMLQLADRVRAFDPDRSLDDVIERMLEIERERDGYRNPDRRRRRRLRRAPDGVACFNYMYLRVSEEVRRSLGRFESPAYVERLAVVFAGFYLAEADAARAGAWLSPAWEPLFEGCRSKRVKPVQFALAGMNAHINNDLPWALLQSWEELGAVPAEDSSEYRDFQLVNDILEAVAGEVRATLESGLIRFLDRLFGRLDDLCASFVIAKGRAEAWRRGARWSRGLDEAAAEAHERHVGYESHLILAA